MDISKGIKEGLEFISDTVSEIASSVAEKNRLRVQLNHLKRLIKTDSATRDQAYIELGRYFFENMREGTTPENEAICAVIDAVRVQLFRLLRIRDLSDWLQDRLTALWTRVTARIAI